MRTLSLSVGQLRVGKWIIGSASAVITLIIFYQLQTKLKNPKKHRKRERKLYKSVETWLLSKRQLQRINNPLPVSVENSPQSSRQDFEVNLTSPAAKQKWDYRFPPKLKTGGKNHLWNFLGTTLTDFLFSDAIVSIPSTRIFAPIEEVWETFIDFESYPKWNPFHSQIDVVEIEDKKSKEIGVFLGLHVKLGFVGSICSYEEVFYVDSKRHVLIYGLEDEIPQSLRVAWFEKESEDVTVMNSYDMIGGYPALVCKLLFITWFTYRGFHGQHLALKKYVEAKRKQRSSET